MAASLEKDPRFEVEIVEGRYGEFTVLVDGELVVSGGPLGFLGVLPSVRKIRDFVERRVIAGAKVKPPEAGRPE